MIAPSIREALKAAHDFLDRHGNGWDEADVLRQVREALSAPPQDVVEGMARAVTLKLEQMHDDGVPMCMREGETTWRTYHAGFDLSMFAHRITDAILASGLVTAEGSGRDPLDDLVRRFSAALLDKLKAARTKYGYGENWRDDGWETDCQRALLEHLTKGDPRDVAAYCAFMWHHGWRTVAPDEAAIHAGERSCGP